MSDANVITPNEPLVVPVLQEEIVIEKQEVDTGGVRVNKRVHTETLTIEEPAWAQDVEVTRVPIGRVVEKVPPVRYEGDTTILPVLEERFIVQKQLVLKEEVHITKREAQTKFIEEVALRSENVEVERLPPESSAERVFESH